MSNPDTENITSSLKKAIIPYTTETIAGAGSAIYPTGIKEGEKNMAITAHLIVILVSLSIALVFLKTAIIINVLISK